VASRAAGGEGASRSGQQPRAILALDPGTDKCGLALVSAEGQVLAHDVVPTQGVVEKVRPQLGEGVRLIVGAGTGHKAVADLLRRAGLNFELVEERNTTLIARRLYWQANPPRGWRRLVPKGLLLPPEPVDDWAAVALARRYLGLEDAAQ